MIRLCHHAAIFMLGGIVLLGVPGTVLVTGERAVSKTEHSPQGATILLGMRDEKQCE